MMRRYRSEVLTMDDNKQYSPYHGCLVVIFFLVAVPLALWGILDGAMAYFRPYDAWINGPGARFIGFGLGSIFHMSCIICGILRQPFRAVCYRVKEFFENLPVSLGYAFECYWDDMKQDGVLFIIYAAIIGACLALAIDGGLETLALIS